MSSTVTISGAMAVAVCCLLDGTSEATKTLAKLELDWAGAVERNDVDAIGRFLHPDFTFTSPVGGIANRKDHLDGFRNGTSRFPLVALSDVSVRVYGNTAVVTSRPTVSGAVKDRGNVINLRCQPARWTDTLVLQDGSWTCVARQQSNIPEPSTSAAVLLEQSLQAPAAGKETKLTVVELEYAPGAGSPPHSHPGPVAVYVLEGAIESQVEGGPLRTYRKGDVFFEPAGGKHLVSRNASPVVPARFLAYFLTPKDAPLTVPEPARRTQAPEYDGQGRLRMPTDFKTWIFVGSNIGLSYEEKLPETTAREKVRHRGKGIGDFHNVYINPEAYEHYVKTGTFPEKTVLVMDVYEAKGREPKNVVKGGYFPGKQLNVEVAVKNSRRPDGKKTDWAYYDFPNPAKPDPAEAFEDSRCYQCHLKHAGYDNVWVQFYPTLQRPEKAEGK